MRLSSLSLNDLLVHILGDRRTRFVRWRSLIAASKKNGKRVQNLSPRVRPQLEMVRGT